MSALIVLLTISFITAMGTVIIKGFDLLPNKKTSEILPYAYGLGVGVVTMQLYMYARLHIPWTGVTLFIPWVVIVCVFVVINSTKTFSSPFKSPTFTKKQLFLLSAIFVSGCYTFFEVLLRPVSAWDAWAIWLLKAKIFFIDGTIRPAILTYVKSDYPLVISLMGTFVYIVLGKIDDTVVLLPFFAFYCFLAVSFYFTLRKKCNRTYSLLFTLFLVTTQTLIRQGGRLEAGQADLAVGFFGFLSFTLLIEYIQTSSPRILLLLNIFLALTGLIKFDGIPITIVIGLSEIIFILRRKLYKHLLALGFWLVPLADWEVYKMVNHVTKYTYFAGHTIVFSLKNTLHVFTQEIKELINVKSWNMLWIAYFYILFFQWSKKHYELTILHAIILTQLLIYTFLYLFTAGNSPESSFERLLVHVAPLALYAVVLSAQLFFPEFFKTVPKKYFKRFI
ncbi:MAG: hypothetical protein KGL95_11560 [Patescibacteria group bacterium]|nr:hypothetical protein [Patescibacteria group bacterium]